MRVFLVMLAAFTFLRPIASSAEQEISFRGSLTVAPIVEAAGKAYTALHPEVTFSISDSSTPVSLKAVAAGDVLLGATARELKPEEKTQYPDLKLTPLCHDGVVIVANKAFPLNEITTAQFQAAFTGMANLKDFGGEDGPVVAIGRPESHAIQELVFQVLGLEAKSIQGDDGVKSLVCKVKGTAEFSKIPIAMPSKHQDALARIIANPRSITFCPLGMAQTLIAKGQPIKMLPLDKKIPSEASVLDGSYPLRRKLFLLTKGEAQGPVAEFIVFMTGEPGQAIVKKLEFIAIPSK